MKVLKVLKVLLYRNDPMCNIRRNDLMRCTLAQQLDNGKFRCLLVRNMNCGETAKHFAERKGITVELKGWPRSFDLNEVSRCMFATDGLMRCEE